MLYVLCILGGLVLNFFFFVLEIFGSKAPDKVANAMLFGAVPAFVMLLFYLPIPAIVDRYDPEPWWSLAMAFFWGAIVATGVAGFVNTAVHIFAAGAFGEPAGNLITTVISAPISEEVMKGVVILGFLYFLKREFDGTVDGIIYAIFCALGFAAVENVSYYARAALQGQDVFVATFFLRGIVAPWGHPLYTAMTGLGIGIARESSRTWVRLLAPIGGLSLAMLLHAIWNFVPNLGGDVFVVSLLAWFMFVGIFSIILIALVVRKGRVIRDHLKDEVLFGTITPQELALITSPIGRLKTYGMARGKEHRELIARAARLALCKWHTARAMKGQKRTFSIEFIAPLREDIAEVRQRINAR